MRRFLLPLLMLPLLALPARGQTPIEIATVTREDDVDFGKEILPIFRRNCLACHNNTEANGELVLETPATLIKGGDTGPAILPGSSAESLLLKVASHSLEPTMPPADNDVAAKALTSEELGLIKLWIDQGAKGSAIAGRGSPQEWRDLPPGNSPIYAVAVSPDGQFAACGRANQIFIYHVPTGQLITRLTDPALQQASKEQRPGIAHLDVIQSLRFNHQGDRLASGGFRTAKIWRYPRDVQIDTLENADAVLAVTVARQRQQAIVASANNSIQIWNLAGGEVASTMTGHTDRITALRVSSDEKLLYSASLDNTIRIWDLGLGILQQTIETAGPLTALSLLRQTPSEQELEAAGDGPAPLTREYLISASDDNTIRSWHLPATYQQTLEETPAGVASIAIDPTSRLVAVATTDGQVQLRQELEGPPLRAWQAHTGPLTALYFITAIPVEGQPADERRVLLATAGPEQSLRIWDTTSGKLVDELHHAGAAISHLAGNASGTRIVSANPLGQVVVWNLEARPVVEPVAHGHQVAGPLTVSADQTLLAFVTSSSDRPAVAVVNVESGQTVQLLMGHDGPIHGLAFSPDNTRLATASADGSARIWLLADAKFPEIGRMLGHEGAVHAVGFNSDGTQLVTGGADKLVKTWTIADGMEVANFAGHAGAVLGVGFAANNQPVSVAADKVFKQWNPANSQPVRNVTLAAVPLSSSLCNDRTLFSVALDDNSLALYQLSDGALLQTLVGHASAVRTHQFSADKLSIVSVAADQRAHLWRVADGQLMQAFPGTELVGATFTKQAAQVQLLAGSELLIQPVRFQAAAAVHEHAVKGLAVNPAGSQIYAGYADGAYRGYTLETGAEAYAGTHGGPIRSLAMRPDGGMLATAGEDKLIKFWNGGNGAGLAPNQVEGLPAIVDRVVFSQDGLMLLAQEEGAAGRLIAIDSTDGQLEQLISQWPLATASLLTVGQEGERRLAGVIDGTVQVRPLLSHRKIPGHTQPITSLETLNETFFVSGSLDGTVRHWNLAAVNPVVRQMNHGAPVVTLAIRADGERIASGSDNGTIRLWNGTNGAQVSEMKGDIRAQGLVAKLTDQKNTSMTKLETAKAVLTAAQTLLPMKTAAEVATKKALTDAMTDTAAKADALASATTIKSAAEKLAIEAAAAAQKAAAGKELADQQALQAAAAAKIAVDTAARLASASTAQPENKELAARSATAQTTSTAAAARAVATEAAKAAPTKAAADAATAAEGTAAKALETGKPYAEGVTALAASQATQRTAQSAEDIAALELAAATAAVPAATQQIAELEASVAKLTTDLEAATVASTESEQPIRSLSFSPDGSQLASGGDMGVVHTWDGTDGKSMASFVGHAASVQSLAFLSDQAIISGSMDNNTILWNLKPSWELERVIGSPTDPETLADRVVTVDFSLNGELLATGGGVPSRSGEVKVWNVADGSPVMALADAHNDGVNGVEISPDGKLVASASADKYVRVFEIATGKQVAQCEGHTNHVLGVSWRGDGRFLASSGADNTIRIWNPVNGERVRNIGGYNKQVTSIRFVGQTNTTVACSGDQIVRMNNSDNGGAIRNFGGAVDYLYSVDGSPNGQVVIAGGHAGILRIWNGTNAQSIQVIESPQPPEEEAAAGAGEDAKAAGN